MQPPPPTDLRERAMAQIEALESGLLERETAARLVLLAALAGEHVLLIGPPGTAKSELARRLHRCIDGARYFERLLTRFSTPEELFGPLSLKALEDDRYERLVDGFLPTAGIAFLDEVFKANSAILNTLLTLLNEREFDNGSGRRRTPLVSVVAASNELPADDALLAFRDRFLLCIPVGPVGDESFAALVALPRDRDATPTRPAALDDAERAAVAAAASRVTLSAAALQGCQALRRHLAAQAIAVSDRRWRQWIDLMRTAAAVEGRSEIDVFDLWLAPYVAAAQPEQVPELSRWFAQDLLGAVADEAPWLTHAVEAFEQQLELEQLAPDDAAGGGLQDDTAGKLSRAQAAGGAAQAPMPRLMPGTLERRGARRYSPVHVAARVAQVDEILADLHQRLARCDPARDALRAELAHRLWMPPALRRRLLDAHDATAGTLQSLHGRLVAVRAGFAALPVDADVAPDACGPPAIALPTP